MLLHSKFQKIIIVIFIFSLFPVFSADAILDGSNGNYMIIGDTFDSGGGVSSGSTYDALTSIGSPFIDLSESATFRMEFGYNNKINTTTPRIPTLINDGGYYNKLKFKINPTDGSNNNTDTKYAIAITKAANWSDATQIQFVQNTYLIGPSLGIEDFMTYSELGTTTGILIGGLDSGIEYRVRVSALQGDFTGSDWGPEASAETTVPFLNLSINTNQINFGVLSINSVETSTPDNVITINTNVDNGYILRVASTGNGSNPGLYNSAGSYLIQSNTALLVSGTEGYGIQASSTTATIPAVYNKIGNDIGGLSLTAQLLASNSASVTGESIVVKAKAAISSSSRGGNYSDTLLYTILSGL